MTLPFTDQPLRILTTDEAEAGKRQCDTCRAVLTGKGKYCSSPCRQAAYRHRKWAKERAAEEAARKEVAILVAHALRDVDLKGLEALIRIGSWQLQRAIGDAKDERELEAIVPAVAPWNLGPDDLVHPLPSESPKPDGTWLEGERKRKARNAKARAKRASDKALQAEIWKVSGVDLDDNGRPF